MALKIATWNVKSVRLRQNLVRRLVAAEAPDVLCLQETKVRDELFPRETFVELGYRHMLLHGMKGYNGVAVLSRSEEHTYELQSLMRNSYAVFCLKKKKKQHTRNYPIPNKTQTTISNCNK